MEHYTKEEFAEALRSIASTLSKSEKAQLKLKEGSSQHTTIAREINAYRIAIELIKMESDNEIHENKFSKAELEIALQSLSTANCKVEKILPKFNSGTSQHTLAIRRIKAFGIAMKLIWRELNQFRI